MLYIVSTPIGNLEDITFRAVRILKEVDVVLCEDTREAKKLFAKYDIITPLQVYHAHSHDKVGKKYIRDIKEGISYALISDAGTPLVSDPGILLVKECIAENIQVIPVPGASALLSGLVASGLDTSRFAFWGFVPHKKGRQTFFQKLATIDTTVVFYESKHRIFKTLEALKEFCPHKHIVIARELTKMYEEFVRGTPDEVLQYFQNKDIKGEFVVVVDGDKR